MKNRKIQEQLLIWFLIFTVIPLSVISFWCYLLASRIINQKSSSYAAESIQQLSDNLDQLLVQIENTSLSISYNNYIQNALENLSNGQSISRVDSYQLEKNMILTYDYASMRDITIRPAASFKDNNTLFRVPARLDPDTEDLFYPASDLTDISSITWRSDTGQQIIQMIRPIESTRNFHHMGTLYISLYSSYIDNLVKNIHFDEKGFALILDSKNLPINIKEVDPSFLTDLDPFLTGTNGCFNRKIGSVDYEYFYTTSPKTGWKSLGIISVSDLHAQVRKLALSVITGVLLVSAVAIFISYRLSRSFAEKIHTVTAAMKKASEGDFSVNLAEGISKNEFNDLNTGFNHMIQKINSLIQTVYKAELLRKEAEYASLQAQTNPHFLYNTLDTICWQAKLAGNDAIFDTTYSLASLLRASMGNTDPYITVSQELSYIRDYIQIQKARFRDKIQANIAVEPALMPVMIPKLILQPIVENAFIHGLEEKNGNGTIKISGILNDEEETVLFMIHDNGVGMTRAQIEKALDPPPGTKGSFGLSSVHKRLQLLYGTDFGLKILSDPGKGTTIIIRMPLHVEKAEKEKQ